MSRERRLVPALLCFAVLGLVTRTARAEDAACCSRSVWLAPSYQFLLTDTFEPSSRHGPGAWAQFEFHVSPRFNLGLNLAYRLYPGATATHQLGYGTVLKHFFSDDWARRDGLYPFLDYGLLVQQTFIEGRRGNAVSHDTRLGLGTVLRTSGVALFASGAGHVSRLVHFDRDGEWIPYLEFQFGWVYPF